MKTYYESRNFIYRYKNRNNFLETPADIEFIF